MVAIGGASVRGVTLIKRLHGEHPLTFDRRDRTTAETDGLPAPIKREDGSMIVWARVAVLGDMRYSHGIERVDAETLSDPKAIESMKLRPVVWEHDHPEISPENVNRIRIGTTGEDIRFDGEGLIVPLVIDTARGLQVVRDLRIREVSPEYTIERLDSSPDGVKIQRGRRYSALAVTTRARGGRRAVARIDGDHDMNLDEVLKLIAAIRETEAAPNMTTRLDAAEAEAEAARDDMDDLKKKLDAMMKERDDMKEKLDAMIEKYGDMEEEKEKMDRGDSEEFLAAVARLDALRQYAADLDVDLPESGTTSDIRGAILARIDSELELEDPKAIDAVIKTAAAAARASKPSAIDRLRVDSVPSEVVKTSTPITDRYTSKI